MRYPLGVLVWNFYQAFITVFIEFWLRFEPQIRRTRLTIKFFIHHCQGWKEGSFVCETVWFFSWLNTHPFDLKYVAFCPKFSVDSYVELHEKLLRENFSEIFVQTKTILYQNLWNFALLSVIFIQRPYCAEKNSHKYLHMFFAPR